MWFIIGFITIFLVCFIAVFRDVRKPKGFPPGPPWRPFVGCHFQIRFLLKKHGFLHLVWDELAEKFGSTVGLRLGRDRIVLVSGQPAVKKVLFSEEFDARPDGFFFRMRSYKKRLGIVFVEGNHFHEQKKFCVTAFKKFGLGKKVIENIIEKEAEELVRFIRHESRKNQVFQMANIFDIAVLNSLWAIMAGERFELKDQNLLDLIDLVHESFRLLDMSGGLLNQMPFLRFVAPKATGYNRMLYVLSRLENFFQKTVENHRSKIGEEPKDLIDLFLHEMNNRSNGREPSTFSDDFPDEQLIVLLLDLFMAGTETTSNTLSMAMLYMIIFPEVQKKVHQNLDAVVPRERLPTLQDRPRLKYVEAVLFEVQRHATIVPISVPHRSTKDVSINGFFIPKDTMILINLRSILMDKKRWGDPETFRPERFQEPESLTTRNDWFIPFGQGRRRCLGESLARSSMFLLFSAVMQHFEIGRADENLSLKSRDGVTISPAPYKAVLKPRFPAD